MTHPLASFQGAFQTEVGGAFPGTRAVFRGQDLHADLLGRVNWISLCAQGITGHPLSPAQAQLFEHLWVATSYPDARIWNNRVAALAGTTRSTANLALSAAQAISEATIYGRRNEQKAIAFFQRTVTKMREGMTLEACIEEHLRVHGRLGGYGRPLSSGDERIEPVMALARTLGLADGPHVRLAFEVERCLQAQGRALRMNYGALVSAFGADFGLSPREFNLLFYPCFLAGMHPVYLEALGKPPGAVFPTACEDVHYDGHAPRAWRNPPGVD